MKLSEHFDLNEFTRSATADRLHIDNTIPEELIPNLKNLCVQVLEPLREHFGTPVVISSGYRCPKLNGIVGGARNSQHMKGEAADLHIPSIKAPDGSIVQDMATARSWIEFIMSETCFDQLILEHSRSGTCWIHVSYSRTHNRQRVIL